MDKNLTHLADIALSAAQKQGADGADVLISKATAQSLSVRGGALEDIEGSEKTQIGLRVLIDERQSTVAISDISESSITLMAERAVAMARLAPKDPHISLANSNDFSENRRADALELHDSSPMLSAEALKEMALEAESTALKVDGISQATATTEQSRANFIFATSNGFLGGYPKTSISNYCTAIAGTGLEMERDGAGEMRIFQSDLPSPSEIGLKAGARAAERLGSKHPPTGQFPILFDERISSSLIAHIAAAINGSAIARGASWLKDKMGEQILPLNMSLIEDPFQKRISGSQFFDGEGHAKQKRAFIDNGVLTSWVLDRATAHKLGLASTGNAGRGIANAPSPTLGNLTLTEGTHSKEELLRDMGTGLWVTSMIGLTLNANTGDYSRGAAGFWVENGAVQYPVSGATIAGNLLEFLPRIIAANDAEPHLSRKVPSLLIDGLAIAGQ